MKAAWQGHTLEALVVPVTESQGLKNIREGHALEALVVSDTQGQILKAVWQSHTSLGSGQTSTQTSMF